MKNILYSIMLILLGFNANAADYYWVGGTGNWSDFSTHWATSSGGNTFHSQVPTLSDNVFFDANSFNATGQTVTNDQTIIFCRNISWNGVLFNPTFAGPSTNELKIYGSLRFDNAMNLSYNGQIYFEATSSGHSITMSGKTFNQYIYFNGTGGEWTFQDNFNSNSWVHLVKGTLNTNNNNVNIGALYASSNNPFTLNLGSSLVTISGSTWAWWVNNTGFILNAGTSTVRLTSTGSPDIRYANNLTFNNVEFTSAATTASIISSTGSNFNNLSFAGNGIINGSHSIGTLNLSAGKNYQLQSGATQNITNLTAPGTCAENISIKSTTAGTQATIQKTSGSLNLSFLQLKDIRAIGGASFSASNSIDLGNNSGWTINGPTPRQLFWVGGTGNWSDPNHWALSSGGTVPNCPPNFQDDVFFDQNSFSAAGQTLTVNTDASCRDMTWTNVNNPTLAGPSSNTTRIYGSLRFAATMTLSYNGELYFEATNPGKTITMSGKSFNQYVYFNGSGGEWTFQDNFQNNSWVHLLKGTLSTNNNNVIVGAFYASSNNPFTLNLGSSLVTISGSTWAWWVNNTGFVLNAGTSRIRLTSSGSPDIRYANNLAFYDVEFTAANTTASIISSNNSSFNSVTFFGNGSVNGSHNYQTLTLTAGKLYQFQANSIQTVVNLNASGSCTSLLSMQSLTAGTRATISKSSGTVSIDYVQLKDMAASGGAVFNASNAVDLGNNIGWNINVLSARQLYWVGGSGNWNDASHWAFSSGGSGPQCPPTFQDDVFFDTNSFSSAGQSVNINVLASCKNMTWTTLNNPVLSGAGPNTLSLFGSLSLCDSMQLTYSGEIYFESTQTGNIIKSSGKVFNQYIYLNGGGSWTITDNFRNNSWLHLVRGNFSTNNFNITVGAFYASANNPFTLNLGSSLVIITGSTWAWWINNNSFVLNAGTSLIRLTSSGSPDIRYANNLTFYDVEFTDSSTTASIIGSNNSSFNSVVFKSDANINGNHSYGRLQLQPGRTYTLASGSTQSILNDFVAIGTGGFPIEIQSSTAGNQANLSKSSGNICAEFLYLRDNNATGGAVWTAKNSINNGNTSGWVFGQCTNCTPVSASISRFGCDSLNINGQTFTQSGTYTQTLTASSGCDSVLTLNLNIGQSSYQTLTFTACDSLSLFNVTYTQSGTFLQTLRAYDGCDSVLILNITIRYSSSASVTLDACDSITVNGQSYSQTGVYTQTLANSNGCDSILTLNLNIGTSSTQNLSLTACDSLVLNGLIYYQSGNYTQILSSIDACDSVLNLSVNITNIDTSISQNGLTLTANEDFAQYQWFDCSNNQPIIGADSQSYTATLSGAYYVQITASGCSASSACNQITISTIRSEHNPDLNIYPNPNKGSFTIDLGMNAEMQSFSIYNIAGQEILAKYELNMHTIIVNFEAAAGIYFLKSDNLKSVYKIIKTE
jgi:hypothetical protein